MRCLEWHRMQRLRVRQDADRKKHQGRMLAKRQHRRRAECQLNQAEREFCSDF